VFLSVFLKYPFVGETKKDPRLRRYEITRNLLACGTGTSRVAHPSDRYKRSRRLNVKPFTMALPKAIMLRIQAAGQNSPDIQSAGICRVNHLAAPRVVATRLGSHTLRSAALVRIES